MPGRSDVRAGSAFIELGTTESKLIKGLAAAMKRVRSFADQAAGVGRNIGLFGAGATGAMVGLAKGFADSGAAVSRLQKQTGLSARSLSGLTRAAADNDVSFETLRKGMTSLQKASANGGTEVEEALGNIGLTLDEMRAMRPDAVLAAVADGLPRIADEEERTAAATALLGRAGVDLLPAFEGGAAGLERAADAADRAGQSFSQEALDAAAKLDDAMDSLAGSVLGLRNAIGEALTPALAPLIEGLSHVVENVTAWVKQNPEAVQSVLGLTVGITGLGVALATVATTVAALSSPVFLLFAGLLAVTGAALATTDALGVTNTGFGELFNSVRVGGRGLSTWFGLLVVGLTEEWDTFIDGLSHAWLSVSTAAKNAGSYIYTALVWVPRKLLEAFRWMVGGINTMIEGLAKAWNATVGSITGEIKPGAIGTETVDGWIAKLQSEQDETLREVDERSAERDSTQRAITRNAMKRSAAAEQKALDIALADPDDGSSFRFDPKRAGAGLLQIGSSIADGVKKAVEGLKSATSREGAGGDGKPADGDKPQDGAGAKAKDTSAEQRAAQERGANGSEDAPGAGESIQLASDSSERDESIDALGTFNAGIAGQLGIGPSLSRIVGAADDAAQRADSSLRFRGARVSHSVEAGDGPRAEDVAQLRRSAEALERMTRAILDELRRNPGPIYT